MCPCQYGAALSSAPRRGLLLFLACCATPIQVERAEPREMEHELDSNILSTGHISELTRTVREVRRILLRHLVEACPKGCAPPAAAGSRPLADAMGATQRRARNTSIGSTKSKSPNKQQAGAP